MNFSLTGADLAMLAPAAGLALWSMIVLLIMTAKRLPAFKNAGVDLRTAEPGGRYVDIEPNLPKKVNWTSHNYTHLMEQPTLFYAVVIILALSGGANDLHIALAWAYTGLRVLHSIWQMFVNVIAVRFLLFGLSSLCLLVLSFHAFLVTIH